jgi:hypothetical protein
LRKKSFTVSFFLISLVVGVQAVVIAEANPWLAWQGVDPIQDSAPPPINIISPLNNTIYPSKTILFNFSTSHPTAPIPVAGTGVAMVRYSIDNPNPSSFFEQTTGLYYCTSTGGSSSGPAYVGLPEFTYSNLLNLTEGNHSLTVFSDGVISPGNLTMYWISSNATVFFSVDTNRPQIETLAPIMPLSALLSESASALNFGDRVNFTVSVEGGRPPYIYVWYIDNGLVENNTSPYYSTNNQSIGAHHMYVQVTDADNNMAQTLTVEFNVLPSPTFTLSPSASPTPQQTNEPSPTPIVDHSYGWIPYALVLAVVSALAAFAIYVRKRRRKG